jgi:hypothetical protein
VNCVLRSLAGYLLVRRRRRVRVLVVGALRIAGWSSNLHDRLGLHTVTAPGSVRGAVDFVQLGQPCSIVADLVIVGTTALLLPVLCVSGDQGGVRSAATRYPTPAVRPRALPPGAPRHRNARGAPVRGSSPPSCSAGRWQAAPSARWASGPR